MNKGWRSKCCEILRRSKKLSFTLASIRFFRRSKILRLWIEYSLKCRYPMYISGSTKSSSASRACGLQMRRREEWVRDRCKWPTVKGWAAPLAECVPWRRLCKAFAIVRGSSLRASISSLAYSPKSVPNTLKKNAERTNASASTVITSSSTSNRTKKRPKWMLRGPEWRENSVAMPVE